MISSRVSEPRGRVLVLVLSAMCPPFRAWLWTVYCHCSIQCSEHCSEKGWSHGGPTPFQREGLAAVDRRVPRLPDRRRSRGGTHRPDQRLRLGPGRGHGGRGGHQHPPPAWVPPPAPPPRASPP